MEGEKGGWRGGREGAERKRGGRWEGERSFVDNQEVV
jgi:hypothetical protein